MTAPRFLQIHTLHSYTAALLNRDDTGLAKRLPYGGTMRTRISSQCLKRHWRMARHDPHALDAIDGAEEAYRSRELVTEMVIGPLKGRYPDEIVAALEPEFQKAVYGDKADKGKKSRQTLLLGAPEIAWLAREAERLAAEVDDADMAKEALAEWAKAFKDNIKALREATALPGGLASALFGRMVTSDPAANIEAPVYVAHAFTVHAEEAEGDYFTAVDDLKREEDDSGADTIQETELTSGLFYGHVVIDLPGLIANCGGQRDLAARVVHNLVHLIAEVSPGAKRGSTAPFGRADLMLIEAGDRQPRNLATAYREAIPHDREEAVLALDRHLARYDETYETGETRRYLSLAEAPLTGPEESGLTKLSLKALAAWAEGQVKDAPDA
ncbi:MAG: type I-E CRISPR-associated protein Cas7/Cse4/CasC [Kiloniellales bacterium]|nr:type I-E CRISPR-associated protein Cas7/Cse4/CasC [Kiloniellales bacterium]